MESPSPSAGPSLRERKKKETRQRISDHASLLFATRGFDAVTVAEIAAAAGVSTMTVFNHFPRKEDLFLDRIPKAAELLTTAVRDRAASESPVAAVGRLAHELLATHHPLSAVGEHFAQFFRVVVDSPALRARAREGVEELEGAVARAITESPGGGSGSGPSARLVATMTVTAYRHVFVEAARQLLAGEGFEEVAREQATRIDATFGAAERGLYGTPGGVPQAPDS